MEIVASGRAPARRLYATRGCTVLRHGFAIGDGDPVVLAVRRL